MPGRVVIRLVGAIGREYATTLGELGSYRHGRGGDKRCYFVEKNRPKIEGAAHRPPTGEAAPPDQTIGFPLLYTPWAAPVNCKLINSYRLSSTLTPASWALHTLGGGGGVCDLGSLLISILKMLLFKNIR